jgi:RecG-like helicase
MVASDGKSFKFSTFRMNPTAKRLSLDKLDRSLWPVRRALHWAVRQDHPVPYLAENTSRWLHVTLDQPLPESIADSLRAIEATLVDESIEGSTRAQTAWQMLARVDSLLGLPLSKLHLRAVPPPKLPKPKREKRPPREEAPSAPLPDDLDDVLLTVSDELAETIEPVRAFWDGGLETPWAEVGISEDLASRLTADGVATVGDLLDRQPSSYEHCEPVHGAGRDTPDGRVAIGGRVRRRWTEITADGTQLFRALVAGADEQECLWEEAVTFATIDELAIGTRVVLIGEFSEGLLRNASLAVEHEKRAHLASYQFAHVLDEEVRALIRNLFRQVKDLRDPLPRQVRERNQLVPLSEALETVHLWGGSEEAVRRLAFDEAFAAFAGRTAARLQRTRDRGIPHAVVHDYATRLLEAMDVALTDDQASAFDSIKRDLRARTSMFRVLNGPCGSARGRVALLTMAMVAEGKTQVLYVAPDARTAEARFLHSEALLRDVGLVARLIKDEPSDALLDAISRGELHVIFASRALVEAKPSYRRLGLVIWEAGEATGDLSDFHSLQPAPDLMVLSGGNMSAETLLAAYPSASVSTIQDATKAKVTVRSWVAEKRMDAYARAVELVGEGRQVLVTFPVKGDGGGDIFGPAEAARAVSALKKEAFPDARVALFHGEMSREERQSGYEDFVHCRVDVLVATCSAELGPPIPNLGAVVIEQAEHLSPVRRMRLKGQVASSWHGGELLMVVGDEERETSLVKETRGHGVVKGNVEGLPSFHWLDPATHWSILVTARAEAGELIAADPKLAQSRGMQAAIVRRWSGMWGDDLACPFVGGGDRGRKRRRRRKRKRKR